MAHIYCIIANVREYRKLIAAQTYIALFIRPVCVLCLCMCHLCQFGRAHLSHSLHSWWFSTHKIWKKKSRHSTTSAKRVCENENRYIDCRRQEWCGEWCIHTRTKAIWKSSWWSGQAGFHPTDDPSNLDSSVDVFGLRLLISHVANLQKQFQFEKETKKILFLFFKRMVVLVTQCQSP